MKRRIVILFALMPVLLYSQIDTIKRDSLIGYLRKTNSEKEKIKAYTELGMIYEATNYSLGLSYADTVLELAKKYKDEASEAEAYVIFGNIYWYLGEHDKVMKNYLDALSIREKLKDQRALGVIKYNISLLFNSLGNNEEALRYAFETVEHYKKSGHKDEMCEIYIHISNIYVENKDAENEAKYFNLAKNLLPELENNHSKANLFMNMAFKFKKINFDSSLYYYKKAFYLDSLDNQVYLMTATLNNIGSLFSSAGRFDEAIKYTLHAVEIGQKNNLKLSLSYSFGNLAEYYAKKGNYEKAYEYLANYSGIKWELYREDSQKLANEMEAKFQDEKKQLIIEKQQKENEAKDARIEKQEEENKRANEQKLFIGGGLVLMIIITLVIYRNLQRKKRDNALITSQKEEIAVQKEELEEKHTEIRDSIDYAKKIQSALLTNEDYWNEISKEHFILFQPKDVVSGDFYWAYFKDDIAIWCASDCTGHGVPGAFMSMLGISYLNEIIIESGITDPKIILDKLRNKIIQALIKNKSDVKQRDGMDMALCAWNKKTNVLEYAGANNPLWIVRNKKGAPLSGINSNQPELNVSDDNYDLYELKPARIPVGQYGDQLEDYTKVVIKLLPGDLIYSFSDGYADQFGGPNGKKLRNSNFKKLIIQHAGLNCSEQKTILAQHFAEWKTWKTSEGTVRNMEQIDDICVIGVRVT